VLEAEILSVSGGHDRLRLDRLERAAADLLVELCNKHVFATTLGGVRIAVTARGELEVSRAPPRRIPPSSA